jgi:hypothetical protein
MELISTRMPTRLLLLEELAIRLLEELRKRMLAIRKGVPTLRRHRVVRVVTVVEALAEF